MEILAVCKGRCTLLRKLSARSPRIWTLDDDLGDGDDVEVMVMVIMVIMVIITIGCQCMETKEMQALENDYASAEADEGLVVQPGANATVMVMEKTTKRMRMNSSWRRVKSWRSPFYCRPRWRGRW